MEIIVKRFNNQVYIKYIYEWVPCELLIICCSEINTTYFYMYINLKKIIYNACKKFIKIYIKSPVIKGVW